MIDPRSGVPAWRQLADDLRKRIARGVYAPGSRLPSEAHLGQEYGLGRTTVRRAIAALRAEGVIVVQHGWGMRVPEPIELEEIPVEPGQLVTIRMPTPEERAAFEMPEGVALFVVHRGGGWQDSYPGDRYAIRIPRT